MLNMAASMLSTLVSLAISFVLSPIIIEKLDFEAQGFMTLATDFVSYANIAAMALNSMAGRFITVSLTKGDLKKANEYFNSTMYANMGIVGFLFIPSVLIVLFLDKLNLGLVQGHGCDLHHFFADSHLAGGGLASGCGCDGRGSFSSGSDGAV